MAEEITTHDVREIINLLKIFLNDEKLKSIHIYEGDLKVYGIGRSINNCFCKFMIGHNNPDEIVFFDGTHIDELRYMLGHWVRPTNKARVVLTRFE